MKKKVKIGGTHKKKMTLTIKYNGKLNDIKMLHVIRAASTQHFQPSI
jgi:hypothetical protein